MKLKGETHLTDQWVSAVGAVKADWPIHAIRASFNTFELHRSSEAANFSGFDARMSTASIKTTVQDLGSDSFGNLCQRS